MSLRLSLASALGALGLAGAAACQESTPPPKLAQAPIEYADAGAPPTIDDPLADADTVIQTTLPGAGDAGPQTQAPLGPSECQRYIEHYAELIFKDRGEGPWDGKPLPPGWTPGGVMLGIRDQCLHGELARKTFDCAMGATTMPVWMKCVHP